MWPGNAWPRGIGEHQHLDHPPRMVCSAGGSGPPCYRPEVLGWTPVPKTQELVQARSCWSWGRVQGMPRESKPPQEACMLTRESAYRHRPLKGAVITGKIELQI